VSSAFFFFFLPVCARVCVVGEVTEGACVRIGGEGVETCSVCFKIG
jgi:NADPH-dependent glutamate synthase beta subunit-like oxidoreductase